jgi:hypothetical protein
MEAEIRAIARAEAERVYLGVLTLLAAEPTGTDPRGIAARELLAKHLGSVADAAEEIVDADTPLAALRRRARYPRK